MANAQPTKRTRAELEDGDADAEISIAPQTSRKERFHSFLAHAKREIGYFKSLQDFARKHRPRHFITQLARGILLERDQLRLRPFMATCFTYDWDTKEKAVIPGTVKFGGESVGPKVEWFISVYQYAVKNRACATIKLEGDAIFIVYDYVRYQKDGKEYHATFGARTEIPPEEDPLVILITRTLTGTKKVTQNSMISRLAECTMKVLPLISDKSLDVQQLVQEAIDTKSFKALQRLRETHPDARMQNFSSALSSFILDNCTMEELTSKDNLSYSTASHLKAMVITQNRFRMFYRVFDKYQYAEMAGGEALSVISLKDLEETDFIVCIKSHVGHKFFTYLKDDHKVLVTKSDQITIGKKRKQQEEYESFGAHYQSAKDVILLRKALKSLSVGTAPVEGEADAEAAAAVNADGTTTTTAEPEVFGDDADFDF